MRTKHAEKTRVGVLGIVAIHLPAGDVTNGIRAAPLPVRCGSGTNQAEAGGHVTPGLKRAGSDRRCKRHGQGAAPGRLLREGYMDEPTHRNERVILRLCGYGTTQYRKA